MPLDPALEELLRGGGGGPFSLVPPQQDGGVPPQAPAVTPVTGPTDQGPGPIISAPMSQEEMAGLQQYASGQPVTAGIDRPPAAPGPARRYPMNDAAAADAVAPFLEGVPGMGDTAQPGDGVLAQPRSDQPASQPPPTPVATSSPGTPKEPTIDLNALAEAQRAARADRASIRGMHAMQVATSALSHGAVPVDNTDFQIAIGEAERPVTDLMARHDAEMKNYKAQVAAGNEASDLSVAKVIAQKLGLDPNTVSPHQLPELQKYWDMKVKEEKENTNEARLRALESRWAEDAATRRYAADQGLRGKLGAADINARARLGAASIGANSREKVAGQNIRGLSMLLRTAGPVDVVQRHVQTLYNQVPSTADYMAAKADYRNSIDKQFDAEATLVLAEFAKQAHGGASNEMYKALERTRPAMGSGPEAWKPWLEKVMEYSQATKDTYQGISSAVGGPNLYPGREHPQLGPQYQSPSAPSVGGAQSVPAGGGANGLPPGAKPKGRLPNGQVVYSVPGGPDVVM